MSHSRANSSRDLVVDVAETAEGAFAVDLRQSIVAWNAAAEALLGYGEQEVLGRKCGSVLGICGTRGADCDTQRCNAIANMLRGRLTSHIEVEVQARTGSVRRLSMSIVPTHSTNGDVHVLHLFHDIGQDRRQASADDHAAMVRATHPPMQTDSHGRGRGEVPRQLTHREREVLHLLAAGQTTKEIAAALSISPITVRNHVTRVIEKLDVKTRLQAVVAASHWGLI
jgi:PAS domain S-box-containing protein